MMKRAFLAAGAVALGFASPSAAQDADGSGPVDQGKLSGDYIVVGAGAGYGPTYEGSNDYRIFPAPLIQGRFHGVMIAPRGAGVALDFIPDAPGKVGFNLGVAAKARLNRTRKTGDPVVDRLGKLKTAVEVGPTVGLTFPHVLNAYDSFTLTTDVLWDVAGAHKGMVVDPSVSYTTPLSRGILASLSANAEWGNGKFARYNYSVTPAGSLASGLPVFTARNGFNKAGARLLVGFDLDGDITNGGPAIFAVAGYSRMLGDAKRTPLTSLRGSADQLLGVVGFAYTF